jgi:hypothetical protein
LHLLFAFAIYPGINRHDRLRSLTETVKRAFPHLLPGSHTVAASPTAGTAAKGSKASHGHPTGGAHSNSSSSPQHNQHSATTGSSPHGSKHHQHQHQASKKRSTMVVSSAKFNQAWVSKKNTSKRVVGSSTTVRRNSIISNVGETSKRIAHSLRSISISRSSFHSSAGGGLTATAAGASLSESAVAAAAAARATFDISPGSMRAKLAQTSKPSRGAIEEKDGGGSVGGMGSAMIVPVAAPASPSAAFTVGGGGSPKNAFSSGKGGVLRSSVHGTSRIGIGTTETIQEHDYDDEGSLHPGSITETREAGAKSEVDVFELQTKADSMVGISTKEASFEGNSGGGGGGGGMVEMQPSQRSMGFSHNSTGSMADDGAAIVALLAGDDERAGASAGAGAAEKDRERSSRSSSSVPDIDVEAAGGVLDFDLQRVTTKQWSDAAPMMASKYTSSSCLSPQNAPAPLRMDSPSPNSTDNIEATGESGYRGKGLGAPPTAGGSGGGGKTLRSSVSARSDSSPTVLGFSRKRTPSEDSADLNLAANFPREYPPNLKGHSSKLRTEMPSSRTSFGSMAGGEDEDDNNKLGGNGNGNNRHRTISNEEDVSGFAGGGAGGGGGGVGSMGGAGALSASSGDALGLLDSASGGGGGGSKRSSGRHNRNWESEESDIADVFLFSWPELYLEGIQSLLMIVALYYALFFTNFVASAGSPMWKVLTLLPAVLSTILLVYIVKCAVLVSALHAVDCDAILEVLEQTEGSKQLADTIRAKIITKLQTMGEEPQAQMFDLFVEMNMDGTGLLRYMYCAILFHCLIVCFVPSFRIHTG